MKKKVYKMLALLLAVTMMVAGLAGCSKKEDSKDSSNSNSNSNNTSKDDTKNDTQDSESGNSSVDPDNPWMIGDPDNPIELTVFLNHTWYPIEEYSGVIPEEITRITGMSMSPTRATDYTQLGVLASSGELPDLIFTSQLMDTLADPAICYAYDELIEQYNLDWDIPQELIVNAKGFSSDDHFYFLLSHTATNADWENVENAAPMVATLVYRYDLLEKLGNPEVNTLEDLMDVYEQVKQTWPDIVPLTFESETWWLDPFKVWSGCTLQTYRMDSIDDDCKIVAKTEEFKNFLKNCNYMYQKGYFNADNFSWNSSQRTAAVSSGMAFSSVASTQYGPGSYNSIYESIPDAEFREMKPLSDYPLINSEIGWAATFITKNNKHPEESIRLMQFLFSDEGQKLSQWGREGEEYTLDENGMPHFCQEWVDANNNDTLNDIYNPWFYFGGSKILEAVSRCANEPETYWETNNLLRATYRIDPWYVYAEPKVSDGDWKVIHDKLIDEVKSGQVKVILSADDTEFEKNYQDFIARLDSLNVDALAEFMTGKLSDAMKLYGAE